MLAIVNKKSCIGVLDTATLFVKIISVFRITLKPEQIVAVGYRWVLYQRKVFLNLYKCLSARQLRACRCSWLHPSSLQCQELCLLTCFSGILESISWHLCLLTSVNCLGRMERFMKFPEQLSQNRSKGRSFLQSQRDVHSVRKLKWTVALS